MEAADGLFALAWCPMVLFLYFSLLCEKDLRLACWETAAGRKAKHLSESAKGSKKTKGFVGSRGRLMTSVLSVSVAGCQLGCGVGVNGGTYLAEHLCHQT